MTTPELMTQSTSLRPTTVADIKVRNGMLICFEAAALRAAGLDDAPALRFRAIDDVLFAVGLEEDVDGRSAVHARSVDQNGRISIPAADFEEAFGLTVDDLEQRDDDLPLLVHAGAGALRFQEVAPVDVDEDVLEELRDGGEF